MIEVSFEIGGRKVRPDKISDALERAVIEQVRDHLVKQVGDVRDPDTGERPKLRVEGRDLNSLKIEVEGSPRLIEEVKRRLA